MNTGSRSPVTSTLTAEEKLLSSAPPPHLSRRVCVCKVSRINPLSFSDCHELSLRRKAVNTLQQGLNVTKYIYSSSILKGIDLIP